MVAPTFFFEGCFGSWGRAANGHPYRGCERGRAANGRPYIRDRVRWQMKNGDPAKAKGLCGERGAMGAPPVADEAT